MTVFEKIISSERKNYAIECDNGSFEIGGCRFAIFDYTHKYVKIPGCPASPRELQWYDFTDKEIERTWLGFEKFARKFANESAPINLKKSSKIYHFCNSYVALYCEDAIIVFKNDGIITAPDVIKSGFVHIPEAFVPFEENHIAYLDITADSLICSW
ncbi:hypothetical protein IKO50_07405 [bacterium]|nr:hypothetical protein [Clostridia bacterium]MBR4634716.1 hypothetical protein [bacterium]